MENHEKMLMFIGKCVLKNAVINNNTKLGVTQPMTVQDLCAATVTTLKNVGTQLEKAQKNSTSSRFSSEGPLKISGIPVEEWLDFIEITITRKEEEARIQANKEELEMISKQLEDMKTPAERKKELLARQKALEAVL